MHRRTYVVRVDADTCRRLHRLQRGTDTPVPKIVHTLLRDYLDLTGPATCSRRPRRPR